jgi:hypothetical protein
MRGQTVRLEEATSFSPAGVSTIVRTRLSPAADVDFTKPSDCNLSSIRVTPG